MRSGVRGLVGGCALLLATGAEAQLLTGVHVGAGAGLNWVQDTDLSARGDQAAALRDAGICGNATASFDLGGVGVLGLGDGFGNGLRLEAEASYRENGVDAVLGFAGLPPPRWSAAACRVPPWSSVIRAFGESRPLVPTADGVREPQNRRVELVLR